jgi:hypothetical protein
MIRFLVKSLKLRSGEILQKLSHTTVLLSEELFVWF